VRRISFPAGRLSCEYREVGKANTSALPRQEPRFRHSSTVAFGFTPYRIDVLTFFRRRFHGVPRESLWKTLGKKEGSSSFLKKRTKKLLLLWRALPERTPTTT
jgi:hypothetical protein